MKLPKALKVFSTTKLIYLLNQLNILLDTLESINYSPTQLKTSIGNLLAAIEDELDARESE